MSNNQVSTTSLISSLNLMQIVLLISLMFVWICSASAHSNDIWPYVTVTCDKTKQVVNIFEGIAESEAEIPRVENARSLDEMLQFVPKGSEDGVTEIKSQLTQNCTIGKSTYTVVVRPYLYNYRVQGMCGAAAPSVQLTISRNGKILIRDLVFRINCFAEGNTEMQVEEIAFSEPKKHAVFQLRQKNLLVQKTLKFQTLPMLRRESLFK